MLPLLVFNIPPRTLMVDTASRHEQGQSTALYDLTQRVPVELLRYVVNDLPASQLLLLSGVSRRFRGVVASDARFFIPLRIHITTENLFADVCSAQLDHIRAVLKYAVPGRLRVAMTILYEHGPTLERLGQYPKQGSSFFRRYMCDYVFPVVQIALPILVRLAVTIPDEYGPALRTRLLEPAPLLRELQISTTSPLNLPGEFPFVTVPPNIFAGQAPRLLRVSLSNAMFGSTPIPAFASARQVSLTYQDHDHHLGFDLCVSRIFPRVADLEFVYEPYENFIWPPTTVDLSNLRLNHLHIGDFMHCGLIDVLADAFKLDFQHIPSITHACWEEDLRGCVPIVDAMPGDLGLRMRAFEARGVFEASFVSLEFNTRRVFQFLADDRRDDDDYDPFEECTSFATRIVDLRIDNRLLRSLLEFRCDLPVLRHLQLDLFDDAVFESSIWFPEGDSDDDNLSEHHPVDLESSDEYLLLCPVLEKITLVARNEEWTACPRQVEFLGCALGQLERPRAARAHLEMVGVAFSQAETSSHSRLRVFPKISYRDFEDLDSDPGTEEVSTLR